MAKLARPKRKPEFKYVVGIMKGPYYMRYKVWTSPRSYYEVVVDDIFTNYPEIVNAKDAPP